MPGPNRLFAENPRSPEGPILVYIVHSSRRFRDVRRPPTKGIRRNFRVAAAIHALLCVCHILQVAELTQLRSEDLSLSLNGQDSLSNDASPLAALGVHSGDLLYCTTRSINTAQSHAPPSVTAPMLPQKGERPALELGSAAVPAIRDTKPELLPKPQTEHPPVAQQISEEVHACLASLEPLLATAESDDDYIVLAVHAILYLSGFELCESEAYGVEGGETVGGRRVPLPKAWRRGANGFRFEYVQPEFPERIQLHAVSIGRLVNFHARVGGSATIFRLCLRPSEFCRQTADRPAALSALVKTVTTKLARRMQFALLGVPSGFHSFGELFRATKLHILAYLPVGAVGLVMQVRTALQCSPCCPCAPLPHARPA